GCADGLNATGQPPFPSLVPLTDVTGALLACVATLAGLAMREREGSGCAAQTSLVAAAATLRPGRPAPDPVETGDGYLAVAAGVPAADWKRRSARDWEAELLGAGVPVAVVTDDLARLPALLPQSVDSVGACALPVAPWRFGC